MGARVWCYFCQTEVDRHHTRDDGVVVAGAAFLSHLASQDHLKKMHEFFWEHLIPVDKKESFFVSTEELSRFMEKAECAVAEYQKKEKEKLVRERQRIQAAQHRSVQVAWRGRQEELLKSSLANKAGSASSKSASRSESFAADALLLGKKTVYAVGEGLSCVSRPPEEKGDGGNVYTGATPPWMMEDEEGARSREIGPTAETFTLHLKRLQKQKLPACRVGVNFDHQADTSAQWLPAFGRVWNNGRRLNSQNQFRKESSSTMRASVGRGMMQQHRKARSSPPASTLTRVNGSHPRSLGDEGTRPWGRGGEKKRQAARPTAASSDSTNVLDSSAFGDSGVLGDRLGRTVVDNSGVSKGDTAASHGVRGDFAVSHGGYGDLAANHSGRGSVAANQSGHGSVAAHHRAYGDLAANHGSIAASVRFLGSSALAHGARGHGGTGPSCSSTSDSSFPFHPPGRHSSGRDTAVSAAQVSSTCTSSVPLAAAALDRRAAQTPWNSDGVGGMHQSTSLDVSSLHPDSSAGLYRGASLDVNSLSSSDSHRDAKASNSCRPYKRRRDASSDSGLYQSASLDVSSVGADDSGMYRGASLDVTSVGADNSHGDKDLLVGCRPYKRRRDASSTPAWMSRDFIPITPALLSQPVKKKPAGWNL